LGLLFGSAIKLKLFQRRHRYLLGHTDIAITAKFYTDATLDDLRDAMETTAAATQVELPALELKKEEGEQ
jgi:hypothetical protein